MLVNRPINRPINRPSNACVMGFVCSFGLFKHPMVQPRHPALLGSGEPGLRAAPGGLPPGPPAPRALLARQPPPGLLGIGAHAPGPPDPDLGRAGGACSHRHPAGKPSSPSWSRPGIRKRGLRSRDGALLVGIQGSWLQRRICIWNIRTATSLAGTHQPPTQ